MAGDDGRAQVQLDEDTLARRRRDVGEDHPDTLAAADNLAFSLQGVRGQAARELGEDTLARRRRVLGEDHPDTLAAASNLVMVLGRVGEGQAARELAEDILARRRRVLGEDHPDTLAAAFQLVCALFELGEHHAARELNDDIIARRRRILGDEHPETIMAGAFDLILRGLDLGGEPEWMAALREASKRPGSQTVDLNSETSPVPDSAQSRHRRRAPRRAIGALTATVTATAPANGKRQRSAAHEHSHFAWRLGDTSGLKSRRSGISTAAPRL